MGLSQKDNHSEKGVVSSKEHDRLASWFPEYFSAVPTLVGPILIVILAVLDLKLVFDPPGLLLLLNTCFLSLLPFLVAYIAMKGYLSSGSTSLIMISSGCLSLAIGSLLAGFAPLTHLGLSGVVAIHNSSALLSSVFQVLGVASALVGLPPQQDRRRKKLNVLSLFLVISVFEALLAITNVYGVFPVFFLQGSGPTPLRQTVLGAATAMFLVSGLLLGAMYLRSGSRFLFWYCLALILIAEGLFCISIQKAIGSPIGWLGRGLQYLAGIYLLVAILKARSELVVRGLRLDVGIAKLLRHHLEPLVERRTEDLTRANDELRHENRERVRVQEELKKAKDELEVRVQERTAELETSNKQLLREIDERKVAEEALRDSENRLSNYLNSINEMDLGVFVVDRNFKVRHMNSTMVRWFGDHLGKVCYESVAGLSAPCPYCQLKNVITESKVVHYEPSTPDGRTFSVVAAPVRENDGSISKMEIIADITDRKRAEERLSRISSIVSDIAYSCIKPPSGAYWIDWLTGGVERLTGYSVDDIKSLGCWRSLVVDDDLPVFDNHVIGLAPGTTGSCELRLRHKTGGIVWIASSAECAVVPESLDSLRLYGGLVDITARKRAEEALKESDKQYRTLFEDSIDGVYSVLRDGTITDSNLSFCELFGYTREEMIGKDIRELYLDPADRPRFQEEIEEKGFVKDYEVKWRKKDGTEVDCLISTSVILERDGSITGYRGIVRDLTARNELHKQLQQSQKMEAVGTLAGGIAHDFNNILQVVLGYSELVIADEALPDLLRGDLGKVLLSARNGADLVQRLLTFSRKTETKPLDLDLNKRIRQTQKFLERTIPKMIDIEMILAEDLSGIHADPTQVDQVLMNLSVNARDAMPEGGKLVIETTNVLIDEDYAKSHLEAKPGRYVLLRVSDTGSGIDKETLEHIFEPFYTTKGPGEGTGLGLAMVFGIVKQHHGFINCYSEVGHGTTFNIYLPAVISETRLDHPVVTAMPQGGTETILLVDDEELIRDLGKRILSKVGYTILTASNGEEALDLYRSNKGNISLVMLDLIMPRMGGKPCLEELLKIDPDVKILVASGYSADGPTKQALSSGAKGFVAKPFDMRQVLEMVRKTIDEE